LTVTEIYVIVFIQGSEKSKEESLKEIYFESL